MDSDSMHFGLLVFAFLSRFLGRGDLQLPPSVASREHGPLAPRPYSTQLGEIKRERRDTKDQEVKNQDAYVQESKQIELNLDLTWLRTFDLNSDFDMVSDWDETDFDWVSDFDLISDFDTISDFDWVSDFDLISDFVWVSDFDLISDFDWVSDFDLISDFDWVSDF